MKKIILLLIPIICLSGCNIDYYAHKRPYAYPNTRWVSKNPDIHFEIGEDEGYDIVGKIKIDSKTTQIVVSFNHGKTVYFINPDLDGAGYFDDSVIISGYCKFSKTKLIVKVNKEKDTVFFGQYDEFVFTKEPLNNEH
jgi:hypothetical protein